MPRKQKTKPFFTPEVNEALRVLRGTGAAVIVFTPEELEGVEPKYVQDGLIEHGWVVIESLKN
jgi:hypothetical protein